MAWAQTEDEVIDGARGWRGAQPDEAYTEPAGSPEAIQQLATPQVDDDALREGFIISADTDEHVRRIRELEQLGADVVCLQNVSGADPLGTIRVYAEHVLPQLRA